jgi:hypothetical protein
MGLQRPAAGRGGPSARDRASGGIGAGNERSARLRAVSVRWRKGRPSPPDPWASEDVRSVSNPIDPNLSTEAKVGELVRLSHESAPAVQDFIKKVNDRFDTEGGDNFKDPAKIAEKATRPQTLKRKPWFGIEHIRDSYRFRTLLETVHDIPALTRRWGGRSQMLTPKPGWGGGSVSSTWPARVGGRPRYEERPRGLRTRMVGAMDRPPIWAGSVSATLNRLPNRIWLSPRPHLQPPEPRPQERYRQRCESNLQPQPSERRHRLRSNLYSSLEAGS